MSSNFWQRYRFGIDPWAATYEIPVRIDEDKETGESAVDCEVERRGWVACKPEAAPELPARLVFIDGRQRMDARLVGMREGQVFYGAFSTLGIGAVLVNRVAQRSTFIHADILRVLAFTSDQQAPTVHITSPQGGLGELLYSISLNKLECRPQVPASLVQKHMLEAEGKLASNLANGPDQLVIRDGPLLYTTPGFVLGYVKTMGKSYLDAERSELLWRLRSGERTPIFRIREGARSERWSWYLRSGKSSAMPQRHGYHGLHGVVRLELFGSLSLSIAKRIADQTTELIPHFASQTAKDPRAPQNLIPVGALEKELGRRMGNATVVSRRVQNFITSIGV